MWKVKGNILFQRLKGEFKKTVLLYEHRSEKQKNDVP
jgi:hypothetical protein